MKRLPILTVLLSGFLFFSCGSASRESYGYEIRYDEFEKGVVIPTVTCRNDSSVTYSLCLPVNYSPGRTFPVMLAFDPHAAGNLPVEKYGEIAGKYGYILMGSNNSRNGLQIGETQSIISSLLDDIRNRYATDTNRIYLLGFSGGARVATMIALYGGGIRGVIGCGAGFPGGDQPGRFRFDYIGLAGNEDFNMNELVLLDEQLDQANFRHALLIFDGKHEWPPVGKMEEAFTWNQFCAMKDGTIPKDNNLISQYTRRTTEQILQDEKKGDLFRQADDLVQMIRFLEGIQNTDDLNKQLNRIHSSPEFKKAEAAVSTIRNKEMNEQRMFAENFYLKDLSWWKKQKANSEQRIATSNDHQEVLMYKRIMSYLSLLAYMQYSGSVSAGNKEKADFALEVYRIVDPENAAKIR